MNEHLDWLCPRHIEGKTAVAIHTRTRDGAVIIGLSKPVNLIVLEGQLLATICAAALHAR